MILAVLKSYQVKNDVTISCVPYVIGRCRSADFIIVDVNVSRNHCKIIKESGQWKINDFSSSGTYVNDALVGKGNSVILNNGDSIRFGPLESNLYWVFHALDTSNENSGSSLVKTETNEVSNLNSEKCHLKETNFSERVVSLDLEFEGRKVDQTLLKNCTFTSTTNEIKVKPITIPNENKVIKNSQNIKWNSSSRREGKGNIKEKSESEKIKELTKELQEVHSALNDLEEKNCALQVELAAGAKDKAETHTNNLKENLANVMEAEFQCTICSELFVTAVTLGCTHTFCKYCISQWKRKQKTCPICRKKITNETRSLVVDNYIDKVVENLSPELKERRDIIIKERNETEPCKKKSKFKK